MFPAFDGAALSFSQMFRSVSRARRRLPLSYLMFLQLFYSVFRPPAPRSSFASVCIAVFTAVVLRFPPANAEVELRERAGCACLAALLPHFALDGAGGGFSRA